MTAAKEDGAGTANSCGRLARCGEACAGIAETRSDVKWFRRFKDPVPHMKSPCAALLSFFAAIAIFLSEGMAADGPRMATEPVKPSGWVGKDAWLPKPAGDETTGHVRHSNGIHCLTIHHTQGSAAAAATREGALEAVKAVYDLHRADGRKRGETAYHYFISPGGLILEGRAEEFRADSRTIYSKSPTGKDGHLCIAMLGDFRTLEEKRAELSGDLRAEMEKANADAKANGKQETHTKADIAEAVARGMEKMGSPPDTPPTAAALGALDDLLAYERARHRLPKTALCTHREVADSNCPGALIQSEIEKRR